MLHTRLIAPMLLLAMTACVPVGGIMKPRTAPVLGGALQIGVPAGYCVDRAAGQEAEDSAVVIMGRCADNVRAVPALVTVSVGPAASAGVMAAGGPALAAYFTSPEGRASLSRDGNPDKVAVSEAVMVGDAFLMRLKDHQAGEYWRAVLGVSGRLVTLSATGSPDLPLAPDDGRKVLDQTLDALRSANKG